ncbi:MFS transporter [Sulfolobales archaeon HS-7]|nr:MFS transporter [Sulfolobales archaeon HS-7]
MVKKYSFAQLVIIIVTLTFAMRASNNMLITTTPLLAQYDLNFSPELIGIISGVVSLTTLISSGFVNSRLSVSTRRKVFIASSFIYAVLFVGFWLSNPYTIWLIAGLAGFIMGFIMPNILTSAGLLDDRKQRERMLAIYTVALSASLVVGPIIEGYILNFVTLREAYLVFIPLALVTAVMSTLTEFPKEDTKEIFPPLKEVFRNPGFRLAIYNIASYEVVFSLFTTFGGIYAVDALGASYSSTMYIFSVFFLTSFLSRFLISLRPVSKLWNGVIFSSSITLIGVSLIFLTKSLPLYLAALLILGIPHGLTYPFSIISITRTIDTRLRNAVNSVFFSVMMTLGIATQFITGYLVKLMGIRNTFAITIPLIFLLILLMRSEAVKVDSMMEIGQRENAVNLS